MTRTKSEWSTDYLGRYTSRLSGWVIERSENAPVWNVINPETSGVFDSFKTLREAKRCYSNIPQSQTADESVAADVEALRLPWRVDESAFGNLALTCDGKPILIFSLKSRDNVEYLCTAVNSYAALKARVERFQAGATAALRYVDNLNEDTPVDPNCKECVGRVYFDRGTPEPPLCWIHQLKAIIKEPS